MPTQKEYRSHAEELQNRLHLETFPIAIAMLKSETDIPADALRPVRDLGAHMHLCQGFALSRREGATVAFLKQDHRCWAPFIALGLAETPQPVLDGNIDYPQRIQSLDAAKQVARERICLEYGKYVGIVSAPLRSAFFEPDCVMIYGDSSQLRGMLMGLRYKEGYMITTTLDPGSACVNATIPVIRDRRCQIAIPCMGDRQRALAKDHELILTVPIERLEELVIGVRHFDEIGLLFGKPYMRLETPVIGMYLEVGRKLGLQM
jgi:uncharacterized protein (DUF169 family)